MLKTSVHFRRSLFLVVGAFSASALFAGGFEKNVLWSGKYQGFGGAATSSVNDSEALFFNPAGLGFIEGKGDVHLNFSPTFSKFEGPVIAGQAERESENGFSPVGGLTSAYKLSNRFVVGAGAFVSGGTNTYYTDVPVGAYRGSAKSQLSIMDFTAGGAVKLSEDFSVGATWRATYAKAALSSIVTGGAQLKLTNLSAWDLGSFRVGAQYVKESFGLGLNIRTPVQLNLEGDAEIYNSALAGKYDDSVKVGSSFPFQVALGTHYNFTPRFTVFGDVSWTNYSANQKLDIQNKGTNPLLTGVAAADIQLKWHDQWVGRLGAEYDLTEMWAVRGGYVITSKVTSDEYARATFTPPGIGHTVTAGVGADFGALKADVAVDYSMVSGSGRNAVDGSAGDYKTTAYTAHLGVAYNY